MGTVTTDSAIIERILLEYVSIPYAHGQIESLPVFDRERGQFLLMVSGWDRGRRIHGCLVHIQLRDDLIWIQRDGTEEGIATELVRAGIDKGCIVLAFHPPEDRPYTGFAVA